MSGFWAYENWRAHGHRVTVHQSDCPYCMDGHGVAGGTRKDNGKWHRLGGDVSARQALDLAKQITGAPTARFCGHCLNGTPYPAYTSPAAPPGRDWRGP